MALARKYRIVSKNDFERVFKDGKTVKSSFFFFRYLKNQIGHNRFTIIVSKRVSKKTVVRNRLKRIISEILKRTIPDEKSIDLVVTPYPIIVEKSSKEINSAISQITKQLIVK